MRIETKPLPALTVHDIAEELNVAETTVRWWINNGKLAAVRLPGTRRQPVFRIRRSDYEEFLKMHMMQERTTAY